MNFFWIGLITFYQRFISPYKGFRCAHNVKHQAGTCSQAIKMLISEHGLLRALPFIRIRFKACRRACDDLRISVINRHRADIPCDIPCDISCADGAFDCAGFSSGGQSTVFGCFDFCGCSPENNRRSKHERRFIVIALFLLILVATYLFYGRGISAIYITDLGAQKQSLVSRLTERARPDVRALIVLNGNKVYSEISKLEVLGVEYKLRLNKTLFNFEFEKIEIHDARLNVSNELFVVGQKLDVFENPNNQGVGQRFSYRLKRRWHF